MRKPIGKTLIELGLLDIEGLERALRVQQEHGERLGQILTKLGLISESGRAQALSVQLSLPLVDGKDYPAEAILGDRVSSSFLKESKIVPLSETEDNLILAMADPLDKYVVEAMELVANKKVLAWVGTERDIELALERLYEEGHNAFDQIVEDIGENDGSIGNDVERLKDMASEAPVIRLVNHVISRALEARASDIHIEPFENKLVVRFRIDGILREVDSSPAHLAPAVVSRVKIMANLNIAERRLAQDGRVRLRIQGKQLDLRVSTVPSIHGESVTIRLLEHNPVALHLDTLGLDKVVAERFAAALGQHHGIILVTGPTGSGKTTTLYAALNGLNSRERKIITIEDPVEYQIDGITQIHVNPRIDLTFANVLRSIVRQDPDVIMIGEMRDVETAQIAVQSALTGHLVLSTLHTNDAPSAVTRLLDMGIEDYLLTSTVNAIMGQRLVRTLCPHCHTTYPAPPELIDRIKLHQYTDDDEIILRRANGCDECAGLGYTGRIGIFELLTVTQEIQDLILKHADAATIQREAAATGMTSMFEDGIRKALAGNTTIEEVRRVTREY